MYKYRLLYNIFEDMKTRLDLILILLLCLIIEMKKKNMNHGVYRKLQIGIYFRLTLGKYKS